MRISRVLLYCFLSMSICSFGQTAEEVLASSKDLLEQNNYQVSFTYNYYENGLTNGITETVRGVFQKNERGYYNKFNDNVTLYEDTILMAIIAERKELIVDKVLASTETITPIDLSAYGDDYFDLELEEKGKDFFITLDFTGEHSPTDKLELTISKESMVTNKLRVSLKETEEGNVPVIDMIFFDFVLEDQIEHIRTLRDFITIEGSEIKSNKSLNDYKVINYIN